MFCQPKREYLLSSIYFVCCDKGSRQLDEKNKIEEISIKQHGLCDRNSDRFIAALDAPGAGWNPRPTLKSFFKRIDTKHGSAQFSPGTPSPSSASLKPGGGRRPRPTEMLLDTDRRGLTVVLYVAVLSDGSDTNIIVTITLYLVD